MNATQRRRGWLATALDPTIVRRAIRYTAVVGAILIGINHGDTILNGSHDASRVLKMGLTVLVPYFVSTFSSVGAMRTMASTQPGAAMVGGRWDD